MSADINGDGLKTTLTGFFDWSNLKFDFQNSFQFEDGVHTGESVQELDYPTYLQLIAPDLTIVVAASPDPALTGSNITYTLNVTNLHSAAATDIVITDNLPSTITFVSCSASGGGVCGGAGNNRTVSFASLAGGATATITLVATVNCPVADGTLINNTASVSSTPPDANLSNNSASVAVIGVQSAADRDRHQRQSARALAPEPQNGRCDGGLHGDRQLRRRHVRALGEQQRGHRRLWRRRHLARLGDCRCPSRAIAGGTRGRWRG